MVPDLPDNVNNPVNYSPEIDQIEQFKNEKAKFGCMGFSCAGTLIILIITGVAIYFLRR